MLESMANYLIDLVGQFGYRGLFVACFFENLFPPIPSELIMPFGGILAARGEMSIWWAILATSLGSTLGSIPYYFLWLYRNKDKVLKYTDRRGKYFFTTRQDMEEVFNIFVKYWYSIVFFARFIPLGRWFISLPAGSAKMPFWKFFAFSYAGTAIWSTILVMIGYVFGENQEKITTLLSGYEHIVLPVVVLIVILFIARYFVVKYKRSRKKDKSITD